MVQRPLTSDSEISDEVREMQIGDQYSFWLDDAEHIEEGIATAVEHTDGGTIALFSHTTTSLPTYLIETVTNSERSTVYKAYTNIDQEVTFERIGPIEELQLSFPQAFQPEDCDGTDLIDKWMNQGYLPF